MKNSFFSIVADVINPDNLMVRARDSTSIPTIFGDKYEVLVTKENDYRYRAFIPREEVMIAIARELYKIDYTNFKDAVKNKQLHDSYIGVWYNMLLYQDEVHGEHGYAPARNANVDLQGV